MIECCRDISNGLAQDDVGDAAPIPSAKGRFRSKFTLFQT
jgi:hypothetical protein